MSQPPTAAIAIAGIIGGVAVIFVSYKGYVRWHNHRQQSKVDLPPIREPQNYASQYLSPQTYAMAGTLYGNDQYGRDSWRTGSHSRGSFNSQADRKFGSEASLPYHNPRRSSSQGLLLQQTSTPIPYSSEIPSPTSPMSPAPPESPAVLPRPISVLDAYDTTQQLQQSQPLRQQSPQLQQHGKFPSSSSSTMTIKRNYASSTRTSPGLTSASPMPTYRRDSYLPHLPENRDQIQIVPPQPLGFGLGGLATAVDQKTLAFSSTSGIGIGDNFSKGLIWQEGQPPDAATVEAAASAHALQHRNSKLGEEERLRYLAQGPRTMSPAMRGAVHNHLYAGSNAGSSGMRTPEIPSSRSRSPAPVAPWDGASTSDVGPSVSQRGAVSPSEHPLQHLEANPLLPPGSSPQYNRSGAFMTSQQSPLAMMSGVTTEDVLAMQQQHLEGEINQKDGPSITSSPILAAFRNPASPPPQQQQQMNHQGSSDLPSHSHSNSQNSGSSTSAAVDLSGDRTPGLIDGSVSTENGSVTALRTDSSGRQSAIDVRIGGEGLLESLLPPAEITEPRAMNTYDIDIEKGSQGGEEVALQSLSNVQGTDDAIAISDAPSPPPMMAKSPTSSRNRGWIFGRKKVKSPT